MLFKFKGQDQRTIQEANIVPLEAKTREFFQKHRRAFLFLFVISILFLSILITILNNKSILKLAEKYFSKDHLLEDLTIQKIINVRTGILLIFVMISLFFLVSFLYKTRIQIGKKFRFFLIVFLFFATILPIIYFKYFPSQDGFSHLYNSKILVEYHSEKNLFKIYYDLNITVFPNWVFHAFAFLLGQFLPYLLIEKAFLILYVVLLLSGTYYYLKITNSKNVFLFPFALLLIYNHCLMMGFYSFCLGLPIFLFSFSYWWKNRQDFSLKRTLLINVLLIILYFSHVVPWAMFLCAMFVYYVLFKNAIFAMRKTLALFPSLILFVLNVFNNKNISEGVGFISAIQLLKDFIANKYLVSFNIFDVFSAILFTFMIIFAALMTRPIFIRKNTEGSRLSRTDQSFFLVLTMISVLLYFCLPDSIGGGRYLNLRLMFFLIIFLLPYLQINEPNNRKIISRFSLVLFFCQLANIFFCFSYANKEALGIMEAADKIQKNSKTISVGTKESIFYYKTFKHLDNLFHLENCLITPDNYEATKKYFPTTYKKDIVLPKYDERLPICVQIDSLLYYDYVLFYFGKNKKIAECLLEYFEVIFHNNRIAVLKKLKLK